MANAFGEWFCQSGCQIVVRVVVRGLLSERPVVTVATVRVAAARGLRSKRAVVRTAVVRVAAVRVGVSEQLLSSGCCQGGCCQRAAVESQLGWLAVKVSD